jgi:hypothetical protein
MKEIMNWAIFGSGAKGHITIRVERSEDYKPSTAITNDGRAVQQRLAEDLSKELRELLEKLS